MASSENFSQIKAKTLIVDDSNVALQMTGYMLNRQGIADITEADDGLKALDHFARALLSGNPYGLIFLDIIMPVLDGQETLKRMRAMEMAAGVSEEKKAVIIMATSLHSTEDMIEALIEGDCSDYLVKPFAAEDIRGMLKKHNFSI